MKVLEYLLSLKDSASPALRTIGAAIESSKRAWQDFAASTRSGSVSGMFAAGTKLAGAWYTVKAAFAAAGTAMRYLNEGLQEQLVIDRLTIKLEKMTGSANSARAAVTAMLSGNLDQVFDEQTIIRSAIALSDLSGGLLGRASDMQLLGDVAYATEQSIDNVSQMVGLLAGKISTGSNEFGRYAESMVRSRIISREFVRELERMKEAGATSKEMIATLWRELEQRHGGEIDRIRTGLEKLSDKAKDAAGDMKRALGAFFMPGLKAAWDSILLTVSTGTTAFFGTLAEGFKNIGTLTGNISGNMTGLPGRDERFANKQGTPTGALVRDTVGFVNDLKAFWASFKTGFKATLDMFDEEAAAKRDAERNIPIKDRLDPQQALLQLQAWEDARAKVSGDQQKQFLAKTPSKQLERMADAAATRGDATRWEELKILAAKKRAEEDVLSADATAKARAEELALADETANLRERRKGIADATAAEDATPQERAMWYESEAKRLEAKSAAIRKGRSDTDLTTAEKHSVAELDLAAAEARKNLTAANKTIDKEFLDAEKTQRDKVKRERDIARAGLPKDQERDFILKELKSVQDITARIRGKRDDGQLSESERATVEDLNSQADDLRKSLKGLNRTLLDDAAAARKDLARMGASKSVQDIGITERFDWVRNVSAKRSPDEEIAENTREMRKHLAVIAKAEGVQ